MQPVTLGLVCVDSMHRPPSIDGQSAVGGPVQYLLSKYGSTVHDSTVLTDRSCGSRKIQV